jgi:hypothetical protein
LQPKCICLDSWYSSLDNLKLIRSLQWHWLTRLKANRKVRVAFGSAQVVSTVDIPRRDGSFICRGMARFVCSGWWPQTATRTTGRAATWTWMP